MLIIHRLLWSLIVMTCLLLLLMNHDITVRAGFSTKKFMKGLILGHALGMKKFVHFDPHHHHYQPPHLMPYPVPMMPPIISPIGSSIATSSVAVATPNALPMTLPMIAPAFPTGFAANGGFAINGLGLAGGAAINPFGLNLLPQGVINPFALNPFAINPFGIVGGTTPVIGTTGGTTTVINPSGFALGGNAITGPGFPAANIFIG